MKRSVLDLLDPSNDPEFFWQVTSGPLCDNNHTVALNLHTEFAY
jgi:hypothetical protein